MKNRLPNLVLRNGIYYVRKMINGRPIWISTHKRTFAGAKSAYYEIMRDLDQHGPPKKAPRAWTVKEWADSEAFKHYSIRLAPETLRHDEHVIGKFVKAFGHRRMDSITRFDIRRYFAQQKLAPTTVFVEMSRLDRFFKLAINEGVLVNENPFKGLPRPRKEKRTRIVTPEEQEKLLAVTPWRRHKRWWLFMLGTGLRIAEVRRLAPADINWSLMTMNVLGKGSKRRSVPILPQVEPILREQLMEDGELWPAADNLTIQKRVAATVKRAGLEGITAHTLRHTFATRYLQGGGDIYVLSQILGHNSVETTARTYAHLVTHDLRNRSLGIDLGIGSSSGSSRKSVPKSA